MTIETAKTSFDPTDNEHKGKKCVMLAHGESGNAHAFYGYDTVEYDQDEGILTVKKEDQLAHEEHTAQAVSPIAPDKPAIGDVVIQREYHMGSLRRVAD